MVKSSRALFTGIILFGLNGSLSYAEEPSFWEAVMQIFGVSATPNELRGAGDAIKAGEIIIVDVATKKQTRLVTRPAYRSPIFFPDDQSILAIQGDAIVSIPIGGEAAGIRQRRIVRGIVKLIGFSGPSPDRVLSLRQESGKIVVELLDLGAGEGTTLPYNPKSSRDRNMLTHLQGWDRVYEDTTLFVKIEKNAWAWWHNVYLQKKGRTPENLSRCEEVSCGQPALSHDKTRVAFVKAIS
ncbi:MAG: hypothetical protein ACREVY_11215 [Gammaproteobacteria bacterium]